jgi:bifunctional DNA-binding transcriptional regulator/antitoxin component of YhaV-PrlF toxin-antitoxin module
MIKKTVEPTGDVCVKFAEEELAQLNIKQGDKFSIKETSEGILLEKFATVDIDLNEVDREILEFLIQESCDKDISVNEVISDILEKGLEQYK